jgi:hypothetical protein
VEVLLIQTGQQPTNMVAQLAEIRCPLDRQMRVRTKVKGEAGIRLALATGVLIGLGRRVAATAAQAEGTRAAATAEREEATGTRIEAGAETALGIAAFPVVAVRAAPVLSGVARVGSAEVAREPAVRVVRPAWVGPVAVAAAGAAEAGVDE